MKITLEFESDDAPSLEQAAALVRHLRSGATPGTVKDDQPATSAPDTKADDAAAKKAAADKKKADDAKKKDEEAAAAAAAKKAEDEAAAAAKKAEEEAAAGGEDDDFLGGGDETEQPKLDREQVRQALTDYSKIEGRPAAIAILNKHGAKSIGELAEDKFRAVYDEAQVRKK